MWRAGTDAYYLWVGADYESFTSKWHELAGQNLRLVSVATYPGCGECANHVVAAGAYNYGITGHDTVYHWPVDVDGANKWVRLSALEFSGAPFTLPFSNPSVKRWNGWLYSPGSWHHAVDYAIDLNQSFQVKAAAAGKVIFIGWDNWSGNTVVISHNFGGKIDAFRTIYMHMRNGPSGDCAKGWSNTVPSLNGDALTNYKGHLNATGCPSNAANRNPTAANWGTNAQTIAVAVGQQVTAGQVLGWAGDTGPGGNGSNNATTNTHLHIFFTVKDPSNHQFYFFDPYGIYGYPSCYPAATTGATGGVCARYPIAWKGGSPQ
ncbi:MAG TPA: M23 family metallopeptidase, partial [Thermoanaerobaculia bacterium]|nr:M23 family metallopeptidase [Thermoanaerobaculia bacterium]